MNKLTVAVLIATADRDASLATTLEAFKQLNPDSTSFEIVIADNGTTSSSAVVVDTFKQELNIRLVRGPVNSRSQCVNRALSTIDSEVLIFTDDDVTPETQWLNAYTAVFGSQKDAVAVCGPIIPRYPGPCADWILGTPLESTLYARFRPALQSGPLPQGMLPLGPNFAVRRSAITTQTYREDLGPSAKNGPLSCDDIAFVGELRTRYMPLLKGGGFYFSEEAVVHHRIRSEQMATDWIFDRFFNYGRSVSQMKRGLTHFHSPSTLISRGPDDPIVVRNHQAVELSFYLGQIHQLRRLGQLTQVRHVTTWLSQIEENIRSLPLGPLGRAEFAASFRAPSKLESEANQL